MNATRREPSLVTLFARFPQLEAELGLDDVLAHFDQFVWEAHVDGHADVVRRAFAFVERLAEHGEVDLARDAISPLFANFDAQMLMDIGAGPLARNLLAAA